MKVREGYRKSDMKGCYCKVTVVTVQFNDRQQFPYSYSTVTVQPLDTVKVQLQDSYSTGTVELQYTLVTYSTVTAQSLSIVKELPCNIVLVLDYLVLSRFFCSLCLNWDHQDSLGLKVPRCSMAHWLYGRCYVPIPGPQLLAADCLQKICP